MLLQVKNLKTQFFTSRGLLRAVDDVSYEVDSGEVVGIVGESGCGKSVHALSMLRLIPDPPGKVVGGEVVLDGTDILRLPVEQMVHVRGKQISMVFQEPMTSLNPVLTFGRQLTEHIIFHDGVDAQRATERALELVKQVGIPEGRTRLRQYPHQFSGGMRQRVMIAMALACNPKVVIADEPTTSVDVTIQAQLLELMCGLCANYGTAIILITHNLGIVARYAKWVNVMYAGHMVEKGSAEDIYGNSGHPYTKALMALVPRLDQADRKLMPIEGEPPTMIGMGPGCPFYIRCVYHIDRCLEENPPLEPANSKHQVACWRDLRR